MSVPDKKLHSGYYLYQWHWQWSNVCTNEALNEWSNETLNEWSNKALNEWLIEKITRVLCKQNLSEQLFYVEARILVLNKIDKFFNTYIQIRIWDVVHMTVFNPRAVRPV